jgi:hypothetical protein
VVGTIRYLSPLLLVLVISSCDDSTEGAATGPAISYAIRDPGSTALPSTPISARLIGLDGPQRLAEIEQQLQNMDIQCEIVTGAVLKGGYGGMDVWRVSCAGSGDWLLSIDDRSPMTAVSCTEAEANSCYATWQ